MYLKFANVIMLAIFWELIYGHCVLNAILRNNKLQIVTNLEEEEEEEEKERNEKKKKNTSEHHFHVTFKW